MKEDVESYLYSVKSRGPKLGLDRMRALLKLLGDPQDSYKSVLVGGTNGKGSTVAIIDSILRKAGYRTGRYISPHLSIINERICVDGKALTDEEFSDIIVEIKATVDKRVLEDPTFEQPTFFEITTAAAFLYFNKKGVDIAVVEVGLGGRLDATNTLKPLVSVITNISLEHTEILGDTIAKIAGEKAGIIKEGGVLVTASQDHEAIEVFENICRERRSAILRVGKDIMVGRIEKKPDGKEYRQKFRLELPGQEYDALELGLLGAHQLQNAGCAAGAVHCLRGRGVQISDDALREGMRDARWPGRMEVVQEDPLVVLDCAKDAEAAHALRESFTDCFGKRRVVLVVSISSDKSIEKMLGEFVQISDTVIATAHKVMGRAADPALLAGFAEGKGKKAMLVPDVQDAVRKAIGLAGHDGVVLITGSVFTVGEAREHWFPDGNGYGRFGRDLNETPRKN